METAINQCTVAPTLVVHLVHGTWAKGIFPKLDKFLRNNRPYWWEENGVTYNDLKYGLGEQCKIKPFNWSGNNSFEARREAANNLYNEIKLANINWPNAKHVIVGHSHGGTVALIAASNYYEKEVTKQALLGIITMATPFIHVEGAIKDDWKDVPNYAVNVMTLFTITTIIFAIAAESLSVILMSFVWIVGHFWAIKRSNPEAVMSHQCKTRLPVYCIRSAGDEATTLMTASKIASTLTGLFGSYPRRFAHWVVKYFLGEKSTLTYVTTTLIAFIWGIFKYDTSRMIITISLLGLFFPYVFAIYIVGIIYLSSLPSAYILSFAFGPELVQLGRLIQVHVEAGPPNCKTTTEYIQPLSNEIRHSSYLNPLVINFVVSYIKQIVSDSKDINRP